MQIFGYEVSKTVLLGHATTLLVSLPTIIGFLSSLLDAGIDPVVAEQAVTGLWDAIMALWDAAQTFFLSILGPLIVAARTFNPGSIATNLAGILLGRRS